MIPRRKVKKNQRIETVFKYISIQRVQNRTIIIILIIIIIIIVVVVVVAIV